MSEKASGDDNETESPYERVTAAAEECLTAVLGKLAYRAFVKYMKDRYGKGLDILPLDPESFEEALKAVFRKSAPIIEEVLVKTLKTEFNLEDDANDLAVIISEISKINA
ncbi:MAG: NitrOD5 domain-containing protein [Conexivisphaerales archaeon]